jgi:hypothetical protein
MTTWRDCIDTMKKRVPIAFSKGASRESVRLAEAQLDVAFPDELTTLLLETDGIKDKYGAGVIWPVEQLVRDNLAFRTHPDFPELYMPFDCLLFFADSGNGDQFAWPVLRGRIRRPDVFRWDHETDARIWAAGSLLRYIEGILSGAIESGV